MAAKGTIFEALDREVHKLIRRHSQAVAGAALNRKRYEKRSGVAGAKPQSNSPAHWGAHPHFNPFHVRSRLDSFAHVISRKVRSHQYEPNPTLMVSIPKPGGGTRDIAISTVPDAAVSYWLGKRLVDRNSYRFSSYSYAYRSDRNAHHAIEHLMSEIRGRNRLYVLEYDFAKYFDSIRHDYVMRVVDDHFQVSDQERALLHAFLKNPRAWSVSEYQAKNFENPQVGIPQGSNVSLFLANVACYELDRQVEQVGVTFARYADDTLILADSYDKAYECANLLLAHGDRSGTSINFSKSPGISLLTPDANPEIRSKPSVVFLGHSLSQDGVAISPKAFDRIKRRVAKIIYNNLLLQPKRAQVNPSRIGPGFHDWDLVTCVNELRRYIYGRITEHSLSKVLSGKERVNFTLCAMSFYPTVNEGGAEALRALDGWLVDTLERAYTKRCEILQSIGHTVAPIDGQQLIAGNWYSFSTVPVETRLPSFYRAWLYVKKAREIFGLERFPSPSYDYI